MQHVGDKHYVAIEAGGTKFVLAHGSEFNQLCDRTVIPTESPAKTMPAVINYIKRISENHEIASIGAGVFGPLDLNPQSENYGYITSTSKPGWKNFDFVGTLQAQFSMPIAFDTDVNAAALAENLWGAAQGLSDFLYVTIGTGIGVGAICTQHLLHGAMHPEMGHMLIPVDHAKDSFAGVCPYHGHCLEGMASGPSIHQRWQVEVLSELPEEHPAWDLEAHYLGLGLTNLTCCFSPQRIILGGGVMRREHLIDKIREQTLYHLQGYVNNRVMQDMTQYIVRPGLGEDAGIMGALALAKQKCL